jgi:hypothetical protein
MPKKNVRNIVDQANKAVIVAKNAVAKRAVPTPFKPRRLTELENATGWMLPNRVGFPAWVASHFAFHAGKDGGAFMPSQRFVKEFLRPESPYRGLLLYHQVGSGKTCSSIYAAENFMDAMDVVVMLPATVRKNFIKEIKLTCGNDYFSPRKRWRFISIKEMQGITGDTRDVAHTLKMFADVTKVDAALIRRYKGVWVPSPSTEKDNTGFTEFSNLDDQQKEAIGKQLDAIIAAKYKFIHYNGGVKLSNVEEMERASTNPFDGKVVVIDEVHNFVSRAIGPGKTGAPLYRLLLQAKNCKLILLSGTPVVNHPYEAAAIVNLINGPQTKYAFAFDKSRPFSVPQLRRALDASHYVDHYKIDPGTRRVNAWLCPEGFKLLKGGIVERDAAHMTHASIVASLERKVGSISVKAHQQFVLPMNRDEFTGAYIDTDTLQVKRPKSLQRRMMGCISYYQTSGSPDYPQREPDSMVVVPMSDYMFSVYRAVREDEIQDEKRQRTRQEKLGKSGGTSILDIPSTYKSHSRETCNFVFPRTIKRVYKKKPNDTIYDADDAEFAGDVVATDQTDAVRIAALRKEDLGPKRLQEYSPKSHVIMRNINGCNGKCVVYSNFKIAEGLGHLAVALEANGWTELKLKQSPNDGVWEIDGPPPNGRPCFFRYEADRNDVPLLMSIFNMGRAKAKGDNDVPSKLLEELAGNGSNASKTTNLRGELIKMMMFTKSGAEGLDLKHVRQVHIMEPYWHEVRIQQVIGRAIRLRSHTELPDNERKVKVFRYMATMTPTQRSDSRSLMTFDKGMSADEIVFEVAKRKHKLTLSVLSSMKTAAVDCAFHKAHHRGEIPCIASQQGATGEEPAYDLDAPYDMAPQASQAAPRPRPQYRECNINGTQYVLSVADMVVYDMGAYKAGKMMVVGRLKNVGGKEGAYSFIKEPTVGGRPRGRLTSRPRKPNARKSH